VGQLVHKIVKPIGLRNFKKNIAPSSLQRWISLLLSNSKKGGGNTNAVTVAGMLVADISDTSAS
jgi:hypothetical protein